MNRRRQEIIKLLLNSNDLITSSQLSLALHVSSKTVRNDIKELNDIFEKDDCAIIESFRGKGYRLIIKNDDLFKQFLRKNTTNDGVIIPTDPKDRVRYLLESLLLQSNYLKMDDLADELFISRSTLQNDLSAVRKIIEKYDLEIIQKPNYGIKIVGDEMKIRFCISEHVFHHEPAFMDQHWQGILEEKEIDFIKEIVLSKLRKYKIVISDISLHNLITHIAISCKRIREENVVEMIHEELNLIRHKKEYMVAKEIVTEIEKKLQVTFPSNEIAYLAIHLQGTKIMYEQHEMEEAATVIT